MRQHKLLVLLVFAFVAYATVAEDVKTASEHAALDGEAARRYLKSEGDSDSETEERWMKLPSFNGIKSFFSRTSSVGGAMKNSAEMATKLKDPKTTQAFTEVGKHQRALQRTFADNPKLNTLKSSLRGRSATFTSRQVTNVGHLAVASSKSNALKRLWVNHGSIILFVIGIIFLASAVTVGVTLK